MRFCVVPQWDLMSLSFLATRRILCSCYHYDGRIMRDSGASLYPVTRLGVCLFVWPLFACAMVSRERSEAGFGFSAAIMYDTFLGSCRVRVSAAASLARSILSRRFDTDTGFFLLFGSPAFHTWHPSFSDAVAGTLCHSLSDTIRIRRYSYIRVCPPRDVLTEPGETFTHVYSLLHAHVVRWACSIGVFVPFVASCDSSPSDPARQSLLCLPCLCCAI